MIQLKIILIMSGLFMEVFAGDTEKYGTYVIFPQGSGKAMAMGGASAAIVDDATAINYNPAGAALSAWKYDINGINSVVDNRELGYAYPEVDSYESDYDVPYSYVHTAAAYKFGDWVFGLGLSSPFHFIYSYKNPIGGLETHRFSVTLTSLDYMVAKKFGDHFAVGITGHTETLEEYYMNMSLMNLSNDGWTERGTGQYFSTGLALKYDSFGIGASYYPERTIRIDKTRDDHLEWANTVAFRDNYVPTKTTVGVYFKPTDRLTVTVDRDLIGACPEPVLYLTAYSADYTFMKADSYIINHGGFEYKFYEKNKNRAYLRLGGYTEPSRFSVGSERSHFTYGIEIRYGPMVFSYSADTAPKFDNSSQSLSFNSEFF